MGASSCRSCLARRCLKVSPAGCGGWIDCGNVDGEDCCSGSCVGVGNVKGYGCCTDESKGCGNEACVDGCSETCWSGTSEVDVGIMVDVAIGVGGNCSAEGSDKLSKMSSVTCCTQTFWGSASSLAWIKSLGAAPSSSSGGIGTSSLIGNRRLIAHRRCRRHSQTSSLGDLLRVGAV